MSNRYDPEVWSRLPFWVKELLEMVDDEDSARAQLVRENKKTLDLKSEEEAVRQESPPTTRAVSRHAQTRLDIHMHNSNHIA